MATFKGIVKTCEVCSAGFRVPQSHAHVRTCSTACGYKVRKVANKLEPVRLKCAHCEGVFTSVPCQASRRVYCSEACREASPNVKAVKAEKFGGPKNPMWKDGSSIKAISATGRAYRRQQPHIETEKCVRRKRAKAQATPAWADISAIRAIYAEAREISRRTGQPHHVDHIVPLKSDVVCGLHTQSNLRVIHAFINLSKGNRLAA